MAFSKRASRTMKRMSGILNPLKVSTTIPNYWHKYNHNNHTSSTSDTYTDNNIHKAMQHHSKHKECNAGWINKSNFDSTTEWRNFVGDYDNCEEEEEQEDFDLDFVLNNAFQETNVDKLCKDNENTYVVYFCFNF